MGKSADEKSSWRTRRLVRTLLAAAVAAAACVVAVPSTAGASTGGGGGLDPSTLDLKRNHIRQAGAPSASRPPAPLIADPCNPLFKTQAGPIRGGFNELEAVSATTPNDIWAAGLTNAGTSTALNHPLVERWNGTSWTSTGLSNVGNGANELVSVYAADPNDVWAVGVSRNLGNHYDLGWHWNGTGWSQINMPQPSTLGQQELASVSGVGSKDIWAVGLYFSSSTTVATMALRWNGSTWTQVPTPNVGTNQVNFLEGVYARTSTDVWAVGYTQVTSTSPFQTLIERWDGANWSIVTSTNPIAGDDVLFNIAASAADDAWAIGYTDMTSTNPASTLVEHWNGTAWSTVASPNVGTGSSLLLGVAATSTTNAWAFGFGQATTSDVNVTLALHWDGTAWSALTSDNPGAGDNVLTAGTTLPGNNVYAVGGTAPAGNTSENTLVQQFRLPAPTAVSAVDAAAPTGGTATVSWTNPSCDGGFTGSTFLITARDGCTVQGTQVVSTNPATYSGLTNDSPFNFTVQQIGTTLGPETPSAPTAEVTLSGGPNPTVAMSACSTHQYVRSSPSSVVFTDIDPSRLALTTTTGAAAESALITGNVDLWTENAGLNQDVGIFVSGGIYGGGQVVAWKESGGFAGTFSPNAAAVQAVIPLEASTAYTFKLQWKGNKPSSATIVAGAGPLPGGATAVSPTRLTVHILPAAGSPFNPKTSTQQYGLTQSNGTAWQDLDAVNLSEPVSPSVDSTAVITANADLFTANAGFNQDLGINVDGTVVAWKESGGFAGTYSPNAAFISVVMPLTAAGSPHTIKLQWKTNKPEGAAHIYAGAGPWPSGTSLHSPTSLTVQLFATAADVSTAASSHQYPLTNSDGGGWSAMDTTYLQINNLTPGTITNYTYDVSANADLFTVKAGLNQDIGIFVSGGAYGSGTLVAWKESGGFAGTFSPNAAYVDGIVHLQSGISYTFWIAWKTNKTSGGGTIWAGAGSSYPNSPTRLTAFELSSP